MNADTFNALYEVGIPVFAYPGARPEDFPKATRLVTRTRSKATVLGGHTDVVWVDGHSACIALSHVDVVSEDEWKGAQTAEAVAECGALPVPAGLACPSEDVLYVADMNNWRVQKLLLKAPGTATTAQRP